jgi:hypothetical protein
LRFAAYLQEFSFSCFFLIRLAEIYVSFLFSSVGEDLQRRAAVHFVFVYII